MSTLLNAPGWDRYGLPASIDRDNPAWILRSLMMRLSPGIEGDELLLTPMYQYCAEEAYDAAPKAGY